MYAEGILPNEDTSFSKATLILQEKKTGWDEMLCLAVHYGWYLGLVFSYLSIPRGLLFVLMTQMICGFLLSIVFVQSHNGMEVYSTEKDFVTAQVVSTRDIAPGLWNDWFTGKLLSPISFCDMPTMLAALAKLSVVCMKLSTCFHPAYSICTMH